MLTPRASRQSKGKNETWGIRRVGGGRDRAQLIGEDRHRWEGALQEGGRPQERALHRASWGKASKERDR